MIGIKYTRYDLEKKRKSNFLFVAIIIGILLLAFIVGSAFFNIFIKKSSEDKVQNNVNKANEVKKEASIKLREQKFVVIQGGLFKNKEYLESNKNKLRAFGEPFCIEEDRGTRVFVGIYEEKEGELMMTKLKEKNIDNSKMTFSIKIENQCDAELSEIIKTYIKVLSKLNEKDIKSIKIKEFKNWCKSLESSNKKYKNSNIKDELKDHINKLPDELHKQNVTKEYIFIYNILNRISNS
ncbi:hypothetical protein [Clostridium tetani]|uniref:hypothetical protein n=1 Tax=Clostridium tetani TaxID=1513 RepID=UPI000ACB7629|nr:hypothetical protein [Clostridium tetani]